MDEKSILLTYYDLVTYLIPGTALVLLVVVVEGIQITIEPEISVIFILGFGYLVGHILKIFGNLLFNSYWHPNQFDNNKILKILVAKTHNFTKFIIRQNYQNEFRDKLYSKVIPLLKKKYHINEISKLEVYNFCDVICGDSFTEKQSLLAREGFYRSASALFAVGLPYLVYKEYLELSPVYYLTTLVVLLRLMIYAHTYYGNIRKNSVILSCLTKLTK